MYPLQYVNYEEQHYAEIKVLFKRALTKTSPIMLGDFNHGPGSPGNVTAMFPLHYGLMHSRGFYSPYVLRDGRCTVCSSNPVVRSLNSKEASIDHVYLPTVFSDRVLHSMVRG